LRYILAVFSSCFQFSEESIPYPIGIPWTFLLKILRVRGLNGCQIANGGHNVGELEFRMGDTNSVYIWTQWSIMYSLYRQNDGA